MTTLNEMTAEHLGDVATDADLAEFKAMVRALMAKQPELGEDEAIDLLFGDGDYLANARRLGVA